VTYFNPHKSTYN